MDPSVPKDMWAFKDEELTARWFEAKSAFDVLDQTPREGNWLPGYLDGMITACDWLLRVAREGQAAERYLFARTRTEADGAAHIKRLAETYRQTTMHAPARERLEFLKHHVRELFAYQSHTGAAPSFELRCFVKQLLWAIYKEEPDDSEVKRDAERTLESMD